MPFLIIPNEAFGDLAIIWIAAIDENFDPAAVVLQYGSNQIPLPDNWTFFVTDDGTRRMRYQRVTVQHLTERTNYPLQLLVGGVVRATGRVKTIPYRLPTAGESPFTVLLGSCYYARDDKAAAVQQTYFQLPAAAKPDVKILCGDQVYLDSPWYDFLNPLNGYKWLQSRSFDVYASSWGAGPKDAIRWAPMLSDGANFFCSDDHEYWNNAPDIGLDVPYFTLTKKGRDQWWKMARQLYTIFQTDAGRPLTFKVAPLSFCIAETRYDRGPDGSNLMPPEAMNAIGKWARDLDGPGVLVVGQPFFEDAHGSLGQLKDRGLPDYAEQYQQLRNLLSNSNHTIVILTGDVHFGRFAVATLRPELGTKLYEVISSPLQLVPLGGGTYRKPPQVFGEVDEVIPEFSLGRNFFLTLEFIAPSANRASMLIRMWPILDKNNPLQSQTIGKGPIELI
jgi:hypothetical protein